MCAFAAAIVCLNLCGALPACMLVDSLQDCRLSTGKLEHELSQSHPCLSFEQRAHLISHYGFIARDVLDIARNEALMDRLVEELPYLKAEVVFACRWGALESVFLLLCLLPPLALCKRARAEGTNSCCFTCMVSN